MARLIEREEKEEDKCLLFTAQGKEIKVNWKSWKFRPRQKMESFTLCNNSHLKDTDGVPSRCSGWDGNGADYLTQ